MAGEVSIRVRLQADDFAKKLAELEAMAQKFGASVTVSMEKVNEKWETMRARLTMGSEAWQKFGSEAEKGLKNIGASVEKMTVSLKQAEGFLTTLADKISFVMRVAAGIIVADIFFNTIRAVRGAVDAFADMESVLKRLALISSDTSREFVELFNQFTTAAYEASAKFGIGIDDAAKALEALVKAGLSGSDAIKALHDALAAAKLEGTSVENVTKNLVMILSQFSMSADESTRAMNALLNMSRLGIGTMEDFARGLGNVGAMARFAGMTVEEAGAFMVLLERRFGSADEAGTALNRVLRDLVDIATKLGIPLRDLEGNFRNTKDILLDAAEAVRRMGGDMEIVTRSLEGVQERAIRGLVYIAQAGRDELEKLFNEMSKGVTVQDQYIRSLGSLKAAQDQVNASIERLLALPFARFFADVQVHLLQFLMLVDAGSRNTANFAAVFSISAERVMELGSGLSRFSQDYVRYSAMMINAWEGLKRVMKPEEMQGVSMLIDDIIERFKQAGREVPPELQRIRIEMDALMEKSRTAGSTIVGLGENVDEFGNKLYSASQNVRLFEESISLLSMKADDLLKAFKDLESAGKNIFKLGEIAGFEGAVLGFIKWTEAYERFKKTVEEGSQSVQIHLQTIIERWQQYGEVFTEFLEKGVREGKFSLEETIDLVRQLAQLSEDIPEEDIVKKLIDADKARKAAEETDKLRKEMEKLHQEAEKGRQKIDEWISKFTEGTAKLGMFTNDLKKLDEIISDLNAKGIRVELTLPVQQLRDFVEELNNISIELNMQNQTYGLASNAVSWLTSAYKTQETVLKGLYGAGNLAIKEYMKIVKEKNGLTQEEYEYGLKLIEYLKQEKIIREGEVAFLKQLLDLNINYQRMKKEERDNYNRLVDSAEDMLKERQREVKLTLEQEATLQRLQGVQSVLNMYTQFNTIAMQALQFAMLGNTEAADKLAGFLRKLGDTTADGYMDTQEYVDILKDLGVTFDEQGKPIFNFQEYLNNLAESIETNTTKVGELIDAINRLEGKHIIITVETRYITTGGGGGGEGRVNIIQGTGGRFFEDNQGGEEDAEVGYGGGGGEGSVNIIHGTGGRFFEDNQVQLAEYQHGSWSVPRTGPAILHEGEMVIPETFADTIRRVMIHEPRPSPSVVINININMRGGGVGSTWFSKRKEFEDIAKIIAYRIKEAL